jgi:hydroxymethylbilane synthase
VTDTLKLGTRGSELALFQSRTVAALLHQHAGVTCEIVVITTTGDRLAAASLSDIGGKRLFVKEIEDALLAGDVDVAVHSSKDMSAALPDGLALGAVLPRADARDAVVLPGAGGALLPLDDVLRGLGRQPRIGTGSVRRRAQLTRLIPEARFLPVRGNLGTRLAKLDARGEYDALVLASAGLTRLGRGDRISAALPVHVCVPAPGQGIIAVEVRALDGRVLAAVLPINDAMAATALSAERAVVTRLGGGCQMPIGAYASVDGDDVEITAIVVSVDGSRALRAVARGAAADAHAIGIQAAEQLLTSGAGDILAEVESAQRTVEGPHP